MNTVKIDSKGPLTGPHNVIEVDGVDMKDVLSGIQVSMDVTKGREIVLFVRPMVDFDVEIEGSITVVYPAPEPHETLRAASKFIMSQDPKEIEEAALGGLEWGGSQSVTAAILKVISEGLNNAADELEATAEVRGSTDGGSDHGDEGSGDGG